MRHIFKIGLPIATLALICAFMVPMASAKSTTPPPGVTVKVAKPKATSIVLDKKFKSCFSYAEKLELPAPPRDPLAMCKGTVTVKAKAAASATCKRGWMGGSAKATMTVTVKVRVRAFSQAIASGRAWALARTQIRSRISGKVVARVNCVRPPATPQVTPTPQPQAVVVTCPTGLVYNGAQCVVQTNQAEVKQDAKQQCSANGGNWNGAQCVIVQTTNIVQINAVCSKVTVNFSNGDMKVEYRDNNGNTVTELFCSTVAPPQPPKPPVTPPTKDGTTGAGDGNAGSPINAFPGAGDSGTAPSADCFALDGNNDPTIPGIWNNTTKVCTPV